MRVAIITQEDSFVIPRNIEKILRIENVETVLISVLDTKGSVANRKTAFARGFGVTQTFRIGIVYLLHKILDILDANTGYRILKRKRSVRSVAKSNGLPYALLDNPNKESFVKQLKDLRTDLVISYSAPCVFKQPLLDTPRLGCVNLHCSYLPFYSGLLPSFWVLYHNEKTTGATVHYMDDRIDNGGILGQARVPIEANMSMLALIQKTKAAGGDLMTDIVRRLAKDEKRNVLPNCTREDSYFSWPTPEQMKDFRRKGGRFV